MKNVAKQSTAWSKRRWWEFVQGLILYNWLFAILTSKVFSEGGEGGNSPPHLRGCIGGENNSRYIISNEAKSNKQYGDNNT
jgi:hypothetical protein